MYKCMTLHCWGRKALDIFNVPERFLGQRFFFILLENLYVFLMALALTG